MVFTASLLGAQRKRIVWTPNRLACLLCSWARHLTECPHLYWADRWRGQAATRRDDSVLLKTSKMG